MKSLSSPAAAAAPSAATGSRIHSRFGAMSAVLLLLLLIPLLRCCFSGVLSNVFQDGPRTFPTSALSPPTTSPTRSSFGVTSRSKVSNASSTRDHDRGAARRIRLTAARDMEMSDEHLEQLTRKKCKDSAKETRREQAVLQHKSMIELHNALDSQWNCSRIAPKQAEETKVTRAKASEETSISVSGPFDGRSHRRTTPTECYELEGFGSIRQSLKLCHENSPAAALEDDRAFDSYHPLTAHAFDSSRACVTRTALLLH